MSDWAVGDLAVCVDDSPVRHPTTGPVRSLCAGRVYRITEIFVYPRQAGAHLLLDGEPPHSVVGYVDPGGWDSDRFRKVLPDKHEACETEFVTLLQRIKRKQVA